MVQAVGNDEGFVSRPNPLLGRKRTLFGYEGPVRHGLNRKGTAGKVLSWPTRVTIFFLDEDRRHAKLRCSRQLTG